MSPKPRNPASKVTPGRGCDKCVVEFWAYNNAVVLYKMSLTESNDNGNKHGVQSLESVLHMGAGTDADSRYSDNSGPQFFFFQHLQHRFVGALSQISVPRDGPLRIADYGCAHGPNPVAHLRFILSNISADHRKLQVFFNDLPNNDFNDLFQRLDTALLSDSGQEVYVAGVPGSFYRELFPAGSIHVAYSFLTLHWLSQVPMEVKLHRNTGKVSMYENPIVAEKYEAQWQSDARRFFRCRGHEMAAGGLFFTLVAGRPQDVLPHKLPPRLGEEFDQAWNELISEGVLKVEAKETFNIPCYFPTVRELKTAAEESGCFQTLEASFETVVRKFGGASDAKSYARARFGQMKSVLVSLVEAHIGERCSDLLFQRVAELMAMKPPERSTASVIFASFRRL